MSKRRRGLIWGGGVAGALVAIGIVVQLAILGPVSEKQEQIARARSVARQLGVQVEAMAGARDRLRAIGTTMLAGERDLLEHRLRAGLSELATEAGLAEVVVTSTPPRGVENPAARVRMTGGFAQLRQRLRSRPDFYVVRGRVQGVGTLEAALRALASLEAQAWVHRVEGVTMRPAGQGRERVEFKADYAVAMAPDLAPREATAETPERDPIGEETGAVIAAMGRRGLFRAPPPAPEPKPVVAKAPAPKPAPPAYQDWRLAGVMGGSRNEAVLVHARNGRSRVLGAGDSVLGAVFEGGEGERAVFRIGDARYEVFLGKSLADRRELK
ncbi:MAG: hypothetical protein ACIARR_10420 [Phycisphaerales bacterium JB059]